MHYFQALPIHSLYSSFLFDLERVKPLTSNICIRETNVKWE